MGNGRQERMWNYCFSDFELQAQWITGVNNEKIAESLRFLIDLDLVSLVSTKNNSYMKMTNEHRKMNSWLGIRHKVLEVIRKGILER